ncbi:response regulator [Spirosoma rigui]|uniref:response regulator n=1 Tax=Spirosoma rigui TaxID=564064 RepID=UPI0009AFD7AE|nr:response regulator [Spirosoma rigui]
MNMAMAETFDASMVYMVDDGADYRFLVQQVFTRFLPQYTVIMFANGDALIDHLETSSIRPALILLDLHMPGLSGQQTLTLLKQNPHWKSIPVVIVTSSSSAQDIQACYDAGANSCLVKPLGIDLIRQRLTLICDYWMDTNRSVPV